MPSVRVVKETKHRRRHDVDANITLVRGGTTTVYPVVDMGTFMEEKKKQKKKR